MLLPFAATLVSGLECLLAGLLVLRTVLTGIGAAIDSRDLHVHLHLVDHQTLRTQGLQDVALIVGELAERCRIVDGQLDAQLLTG